MLPPALADDEPFVRLHPWRYSPLRHSTFTRLVEEVQRMIDIIGLIQDGASGPSAMTFTLCSPVRRDAVKMVRREW